MFLRIAFLLLYSAVCMASMPHSFTTERLFAEKVTFQHKVYLEKILNDSLIQETVNTYEKETFTNVSYQLDILDTQWNEYNYGLYAIFEKQTNTFIGCAGFHSTAIHENNTIDALSDTPRDELELYFFYLPNYWRKGYGFEIATKLIELAFAHLPHTNMIAYVEHKNKASSNLCEKLQFNSEGVVMYNNFPHTLYRLSKLDR